MIQLPLNEIIQAECRATMNTWPKNSVDLMVTSPPYWGLRDFDLPPQVWGGDPECDHEWGDPRLDLKYTSGTNPKYAGQYITKKTHFESTSKFCQKCGAWLGSLGLEPHPQMYVDNMVEVGKCIHRVLKKSGSYWLNLSDTYYTHTSKRSVMQGTLEDGRNKIFTRSRPIINDGKWLQPKQLLGMPWRVAIAHQDEGWILRNCVVWYKKNHMPESVNDRLTKTYEFLFHFVKNRKYYYDLDSIRQPHESILAEKNRKNWDTPIDYNVKGYGMVSTGDLLKKSFSERYHEGGKNPGDTWDITTKPFYGSHFAVFPPELIEPIIKSSSPPTGVVCDPFAGSGTACRVARRLGRVFIGIELSEKYAEMSRQRVKTDTWSPDPKNVKKLGEYF